MIIVLGKDGMLGTYVFHYLKNNMKEPVIGLSRKTLNAFDIDQVYSVLRRLICKNDVVINCIGITNKRPDVGTGEMYTVNSIFPAVASRICIENKAKFIHVSTDCVFSGKDEGWYQSCSKPNAQDHYGVSKAIGERIDAMILRTSIIGQEWTSRKTGLLEWCKSNRGRTVSGFASHYWNGITCLEYAKLVKNIIDKQQYDIRLINVCSSSPISKHMLVKAINDVFGLGMTITLLTTDTIDRSLAGLTVTRNILEQLEELRDYDIDVTNGISMNFGNFQQLGEIMKFDHVFSDKFLEELYTEITEKDIKRVHNQKPSVKLMEYFTTNSFLLNLYNHVGTILNPDEVGWNTRTATLASNKDVYPPDNTGAKYCLTLFVGQEKCKATFNTSSNEINVYPGTVLIYSLEKPTAFQVSSNQEVFQTLFH